MVESEIERSIAEEDEMIEDLDDDLLEDIDDNPDEDELPENKNLDKTTETPMVSLDYNSLKLKIVCEIGQVNLTLNELLQLKSGSIIQLGEFKQIVKLSIDAQYIAEGFLVEVEGQLGVKIVKLLTNKYNHES